MTDLQHLKESIDLYVKEGVPLGGFLTAVASNDLREAFGRADDENRHQMFDIVSYFYNHTPGACWGSEEKHQEWLQAHFDRREADVPEQQK